MARKYEAEEEFSGKVTGIQPYGAFVALDDETQGLVHISEITYGFVKDINEFLNCGARSTSESTRSRRSCRKNQLVNSCSSRSTS